MLTHYIIGQRKKEVDRMEGEKRKTLEKYVKSKGKEVNWKKLIEDHHRFIEKASEGVEDKIYNDILRYLEIKGILSFSRKNTFFIFGCRMNLGPISDITPYNFTRKKDAEEFKKYEYAHTNYQTEICKNQNQS